MAKSDTHECVPIKFKTSTLLIMPDCDTVSVEVTVGVPDAGIFTGTLAEAVVVHDAVVNC